MIVRQTLGDVKPKPRAIALGSFDGVHRGHQEVILRAIARAHRDGIASAVVTFQPHPMRVVAPERAPLELSSPARRAALVEDLGPDELVLVRFTRELAALGPEEFVDEILLERLGVRHVVVGENFRFGHKAAGTPELMAERGAPHGMTVEAVPLLELDGDAVSSSRIRRLLAGGDVEHAERLLGRAPWIEGAVVPGDRRGRTLGFPTANLAPFPRSVLPATGVYAGFAHLPGRVHPAAISVGYNPTFSDERDRVRIEAHLLDFDEDIYGSPMRLELRHRLRDELRFDSVDELIRQIAADVEQTRAMVSPAVHAGSPDGAG
jgi:riboflavin kinase / FMN adenylyltransferase